jgi:hypothetical protein
MGGRGGGFTAVLAWPLGRQRAAALAQAVVGVGRSSGGAWCQRRRRGAFFVMGPAAVRRRWCR